MWCVTPASPDPVRMLIPNSVENIFMLWCRIPAYSGTCANRRAPDDRMVRYMLSYCGGLSGGGIGSRDDGGVGWVSCVVRVAEVRAKSLVEVLKGEL